MGNISKDFLTDSMKKTQLHGYVYCFSVDCDSIDFDYNFDIHKYLMKKHDIKQCLDLLKKMFIGLLSICTAWSFGESLVSNLKKLMSH